MVNKLESQLKRTCRLHVQNSYGGRLVSSSPKGWVGYPDCDLLLPGCPIVKVEFKRSLKATVSASQRRWETWFIDKNIFYWRVSDYEEFVRLCKDHDHLHCA